MRHLAWLLALTSALPVFAEDAPLYRLSYRKHDGMPWVFYADIPEKAKAEHIAGTLHSIGYESQIREVSASAPKPPASPSATLPPEREPPPALPPQPSVFGQGAPSHFPSFDAPPYHLRKPYHAPFYTPFGFWGFGWGYLGLHPHINHTYNQNYSGYHLNAPVHDSSFQGGNAHPTPYPGMRR